MTSSVHFWPERNPRRERVAAAKTRRQCALTREKPGAPREARWESGSVHRLKHTQNCRLKCSGYSSDKFQIRAQNPDQRSELPTLFAESPGTLLGSLNCLATAVPLACET